MIVAGRPIPRMLIVAVVAIVVVALVATAILVLRPSAPVVAVATPSPTASPTRAPTPSPTPSPSPTPEPSPTVTPKPEPNLLGKDGRLTVLLLGSDYRPAKPGNRTDAIMVVSLDPATGEAAGFSIPRDTVNFPLPGGGVFRSKVNGLFAALGKNSKPGGGPPMKAAVAEAFGIEIDNYVFIGFAGVRQLVEAVGGVDVTLDKPYYDAHYWVSATRQGWGLPKGTSHLGPNDALIFARSRKGDNDFGRARRQQLLVMAALDKVRAGRGGNLPKLLSIAEKTVRTDLPLARVSELYDLLATTNLATVDRTVFGPRTYASSTGGASFALKLDVCRKWIAEHFPAAKPGAVWPEPAPASPMPSGSAGASLAP